MALRSRVLIVLSVAMVCGGTIRADMMPVSPQDADSRISACATAFQGSAESLPGSLVNPYTADPDLLPIVSSFAPQAHGPRSGEIRAVQLVSDGQNSFGLCLYTLLSLGLCRSVPLVRRLSFGFVPHWYHDGGPVRMGECLAISPDCICTTTVCCFVQPDFTAEDPVPRYHFVDAAGLWLNTQFTPAVLAARAPPVPSGRLSVA